MTPEQTKSAYQRVCEQECEWCAKGIPMNESNVHITGVAGRNAVICTAPTKDSLIERQAAKIAAMQAALAKGGHADDCNLSHNHGPECPECRVAVCNCYLSCLSDDVERGKELLGAKDRLELSRVNVGNWKARVLEAEAELKRLKVESK